MRNKLAGKGAKNSYKEMSAVQRRRKLEYDKKYQKKPEQVKKRMECNKANREDGTYGKMTKLGMDRSHTKSGKLVKELMSKNRARNGQNDKTTLK